MNVLTYILHRIFHRPHLRTIVVHVQNVTFNVPSEDGGEVTELSQVSDVITFHDGALIIRNCHIDGALSVRFHSRERALLIKGLANTIIHYEEPSV